MFQYRILLLALCCFGWGLFASASDDRPNILWITAEDHGPHLGCYGDAYAVTPHLDALAARGCRYTFCWSNFPVCAPARTTLICGMYAQSLGAEHMRSMVPVPRGFQLFPQHLRAAGYYCSNNVKEDYNVAPEGRVWDESSNRAHWRNRAAGQPFFAVFNHTITHESQLRNAIDPADQIHDPQQARVPAYHPDTPEVRRDWAQYYDRLTMMDKQAGALLGALEADGLAQDTIVFFFSDHGSGMPRHKRWLYDAGLHVPLIVYFPEKWRHLAGTDYQPGGTCARLVSFVDFGPTVLSLCGVTPPPELQGQAFLGPQAASPRRYVFGARSRMDERIDMSRSVSDGRFVYIRNYMPHRPQGQYLQYMFQTPTTRVWKRMFDAGQLNPAQAAFWRPKPCEELYDLQHDPDEIHNLAAEPGLQARLEEFREALRAHLSEIRDLGFIAEEQRNRLAADGGGSPGAADVSLRSVPGASYAAEAWHDLAVQATDPSLLEWNGFDGVDAHAPLEDVALYWAATGVLARGQSGAAKFHAELRSLLDGEFSLRASPTTRIVAAEALGKFGNADDLAASVWLLVEFADVQRHGLYVAQPALIALDELDSRAAAVHERIAALPTSADGIPPRMETYIARLLEKTLADLEGGDAGR